MRTSAGLCESGCRISELKSPMKCHYLILVLAILTLTILMLLNLDDPPGPARPRLPFRLSSSLARLLKLTNTESNRQQEENNNRTSEELAEAPLLVAVNGTHTLLVSAYMEHRRAQREIRVIAVVLRHETPLYRCHLRCYQQLHNTSAHYSIHSDHFHFAYGTADIMCPVPPACPAPSHVALSTGSAPDLESLTFLMVRNQRVQSDKFAHNFTVCISTMFDFDNVLQLVQSVEILRLLGVTRVVIYMSSCSPDTQKLLDYYTQSGMVEVIPWELSKHIQVSSGFIPSQHPGEMHYYGQIPALNDCVYRYMYQSRYIALLDIDELILPMQVDSWSQMLPLLERAHGTNYGYMFKNAVFPNTVTHGHSERRQAWRGVRGVNILDHLYREPYGALEFLRFKVIVNPRAVFSASVHGLPSSEKGCVWVRDSVAKMYHTKAPVQTQLTQDRLLLDDRLLHYAPRLTGAVDHVLKETRLIAENSTAW